MNFKTINCISNAKFNPLCTYIHNYITLLTPFAGCRFGNGLVGPAPHVCNIEKMHFNNVEPNDFHPL